MTTPGNVKQHRFVHYSLRANERSSGTSISQHQCIDYLPNAPKSHRSCHRKAQHNVRIWSHPQIRAQSTSIELSKIRAGRTSDTHRPDAKGQDPAIHKQH